jgi:hypothetical protein
VQHIRSIVTKMPPEMNKPPEQKFVCFLYARFTGRVSCED